MHLLPLIATLAGAATALPNAGLLPRQATSARTCDSTSSLCFLQLSHASPSKPLFRVALPDSPSAPPYDTILEIVSPASLSWTGFAWGGSMVNNPLTIVWLNGDNVVVSSRWASGRTVPAAYPQATYKTLRSSRNATHWSAEVACTGCSRWTGKQLTEMQQFAWASCNRRPGVAQPGNANSGFDYHTDVGYWPVQLSGARNAAGVFQGYVKAAAGGA
ncbi:cellobiose dehydrogenase [Podospora conica]|nr:cellobiose dehydrogenase [Schizothecium conicum]